MTLATTTVGAEARRLVDDLDEVPAPGALRRLAEAPLAERTLHSLRQLPAAELDLVAARFADGLARLDDPFQAARLAFATGILVERGASTRTVATNLVERLRRSTRLLRELLERAGGRPEDPWDLLERHPTHTRAWLGSRWLHLAAMTTLCRDTQARIAARQLDDLRDDLHHVGQHLPEARFLCELLHTVDRFECLVLDPRTHTGWHVRADAVRNNDHLAALLEGELCGPGRPLGLPAPDPAALALARAETWLRAAETTPALLALHPWHDPDTPVDGAASPRTLPRLAELPVLLVRPADPGARRPADRLGGLHPAHEPTVRVVEVLSRTAVERCLEQVASGTPENEPPQGRAVGSMPATLAQSSPRS